MGQKVFLLFVFFKCVALMFFTKMLLGYFVSADSGVFSFVFVHPNYGTYILLILSELIIDLFHQYSCNSQFYARFEYFSVIFLSLFHRILSSSGGE